LSNTHCSIFKNCPNFLKVAQTVAELKKCQNICIKAQFENPKHLHQTTTELLNTCNKECFETVYSGENLKYLLKQKLPKIISLGYFIVSKQCMVIQK
jgi:hypothetical protein